MGGVAEESQEVRESRGAQGAGKAVQSVTRAIGLLDALAEAGEPLGVAELARRSGLPIATVHRLLATLAETGCVHRDDGVYSLGARLVRLGAAARAAVGPRVQPALDALAAATGESANYAVLEGDHVVYLAQAESRRMVRMFTEVGNRVLPHATAVGKTLLSDLDPDEVRDLVHRTGLPALTPRTITDPEVLLATLDEVARTGYATDDEEQEAGVRCVAVPVRAGGRVVAAVSVSGPAGRVTPTVEVLSALRAAADEAARA